MRSGTVKRMGRCCDLQGADGDRDERKYSLYFDYSNIDGWLECGFRPSAV